MTLQATDDESFRVMESGSQIIVVTHAPSKNTDIEDVIRIANNLGVCIHFFLAHTGDNLDVNAVELYRRIAQETGGSVVGNAWEFSNFVASYKDSPYVYALVMCHVEKRSAIADLRFQSF